MNVKKLTRKFIEDAFKSVKGHANPVVVLDDGLAYVLGIGNNGRDFTDAITKEEMCNNVNKICINPSKTYYSVVTPDYYINNVKRLSNFDWIGEWVSSYKGKEIKFGYGRKEDLVKTYKIKK